MRNARYADVPRPAAKLSKYAAITTTELEDAYVAVAQYTRAENAWIRPRTQRPVKMPNLVVNTPPAVAPAIVATRRPDATTAPMDSSESPRSTQNGRIIGSSAAMSSLKIKTKTITVVMPRRESRFRSGPDNRWARVSGRSPNRSKDAAPGGPGRGPGPKGKTPGH